MAELQAMTMSLTPRPSRKDGDLEGEVAYLRQLAGAIGPAGIVPEIIDGLPRQAPHDGLHDREAAYPGVENPYRRAVQILLPPVVDIVLDVASSRSAGNRGNCSITSCHNPFKAPALTAYTPKG